MMRSTIALPFTMYEYTVKFLFILSIVSVVYYFSCFPAQKLPILLKNVRVI